MIDNFSNERLYGGNECIRCVCASVICYPAGMKAVLHVYVVARWIGIGRDACVNDPVRRHGRKKIKFGNVYMKAVVRVGVKYP